MTTQQAATKIVIVAGQEFSVPADTDNEAIRQQLTQMGFADVASATIQKGTREIDGVKHETIEFVKKAGTKGLDAAELAELLTRMPPAPLPALVIYGPSFEQATLLSRLAAGELTFADALALEAQLAPALEAAYDTPPMPRQEGAALCSTLDGLAPVAADGVSFGW